MKKLSAGKWNAFVYLEPASRGSLQADDETNFEERMLLTCLSVGLMLICCDIRNRAERSGEWAEVDSVAHFVLASL